MEYRDQYYNGFSTSDQRLFNHKLNGLFLIAKYLLKALVYSPLLVCGYLLGKTLFGIHADKLLVIVVAVLFALALYVLIMTLKNAVYRMKAAKHPLWLIWYLVFVCFVVALPVGLAYSPIHYIVGRMGGNTLVSIAVTACFGYYVFRSYTSR